MGGLACFALFVLAGVLVRVGWSPLTDLDVRIADDLHAVALDHPGQVRFWLDVSDALSPDVLRIGAVVVALGLVAFRRAAGPAVLLVVAVLGMWPLGVLGKLVVDRDRPHFAHPVAHAAGQSYPSGHALTSFVAVGIVLVMCTPRVRRVLAVPFAVLVAAVGFSRMLLGVHYLTDVVGAWLLGAAWLCAIVLVRGSAE